MVQLVILMLDIKNSGMQSTKKCDWYIWKELFDRPFKRQQLTALNLGFK